MTQIDVAEVWKWIDETLIVRVSELKRLWPYLDDSHAEERRSRFGTERTLYAVMSDDASYVAFLDGMTTYSKLLAELWQVDNGDPAVWFFVTESYPSLDGVWLDSDENFNDCRDRFEEFDKDPAVNTETVWAGLLPASRRWLLVHELSPSKEFRVTLHAPEEVVNAISAMLSLAT